MMPGSAFGSYTKLLLLVKANLRCIRIQEGRVTKSRNTRWHGSQGEWRSVKSVHDKRKFHFKDTVNTQLNTPGEFGLQTRNLE